MSALLRYLIISIFIFIGQSYLDTVYTSDDIEYLRGVIKSSQDSTTGLFEKSLSTTFYATNALTIDDPSSNNNNIPLSNLLCTTLKNTKVSSWEEFHNLLLSRSRINNCLDQITENTKNKLTDGLTSSKLSRVYYSINGIYVLLNNKNDNNLYNKDSLNILNILKHIKTFQLKNKLFTETPPKPSKSSKSKPSIHKTSMALSGVSKLLSLKLIKNEEISEVRDILISFMDAVNVLISDTSSMNNNMVSYSNSLTATSVVLESINDYINSIKSISKFADIINNFNKFNDVEYIEQLVRYILTFRTTTSPTSSRHVLVLMNMFLQSSLFDNSRPISIRVFNQIFSDTKSEEEAPFTLIIADIYGKQVLASSDTTSVNILSSKEKTIKKEGPIGEMIQKDSKTFLFNFGNEIRKLSFDQGSFGIYSLKISIKDDNLFENQLTIKSQVAVQTSIRKTTFGIQYSKKSDSGYNKKEYPSTFNKEYTLSPSQKIKLEIQIRSLKKASQIVIDFVSSLSGESVFQIIPKTRQDKYGITIDMNKDKFSLLKSGKYILNLIIADSLYSNNILWNNIVNINCIEEEDEIEIDYEPVNNEIPQFSAKKEVFHTFSLAESETLFIFPAIFCFSVSIPLLLWLYYIFIRKNIQIIFNKNIKFSSLMFILTLISIAAILFLYWWQWNIFEAAGWLSVSSIPAAFYGYNVLKQHLNKRLNKK